MTSQKPKLYDIRQVKVAIELAVNKANKQARADERAKTLKEVLKRHNGEYDKYDPTPNQFIPWLSSRTQKGRCKMIHNDFVNNVTEFDKLINELDAKYNDFRIVATLEVNAGYWIFYKKGEKK